MRPSPSSPARPPAAPRLTGQTGTRRLRRWLWWSVAAALSTVGVAAAFVLLGVVGALVLLALGTAGTTLVRYELRQSATDSPPRTWPGLLDLLGGWCLLGIVGLIAEFGAVGIGVSAAVVASWAVPRYRKRGRDGSPPRGQSGVPSVAPDVPPAELIPADPLPQPADVAGLSTPRLCWTWRLSYAGMQRRDCPAYQVEQMAALRKACLDELEQRDPVAFQRWLPTARAAGDPARFFCPPRPR